MMSRVLVFDFFTHGGGVGSFLGRLLPELASEHEVYLLDPYENSQVIVQFKNTPVHLLKLPVWPKVRSLGWSRWDTRITKALPLSIFHCIFLIRFRLLLKSLKPSIVWTNQKKSAVFARVALRGLPIKHLHVGHGFEAPKSIPWYYKAAMREASAVVAVSNDVKTVLEEARVPVRRVIYNGIPLKDFPHRSVPPSGPFVFGVAASLVEHKGIHVALKAFAQLKDKEVRLEIAGDVPPGANRDYLSRLKSLADGRVKFLGWVKDLKKTMARWSALIVPSLARESFGLVAAEAMALGVPVIASATGGLKEVVGDAGILFEPGSIEQLANAMKLLLKNADLRQRLVKAGRARVERMFSLERQVREYSELINELCAE